jgi:hypothetical protein
MDSGEEKIEDEALRMQLRRQARKVQIESIAAAILLTALCLVIPE